MTSLPSSSQSSNLDPVLARMAPEVATSFSPAQRQALAAALTPRRHPIDVRLSIPLGWSRVYLVLLAGTETRSPQRRQFEAAQHPLWTPLNLLVVVGTMGLGIAALLALLTVNSTNLSRLLNPNSAPAGIPFKDDQASCEASGRTWQDNACLDFGHDPTF
ncbi:MAG TPA: hypothetical protein VLS96_20670 [Nodosilinea sp.]|nr:hypothetical protein [Nodosilinea sp.]